VREDIEVGDAKAQRHGGGGRGGGGRGGREGGGRQGVGVRTVLGHPHMCPVDLWLWT
jgi:hypothetical protein